VSLYVCALLTFLPTAGFAIAKQKDWYDGKSCPSKIFFLLAMILVTAICFVLRLLFVKELDVNGFFLPKLDSLGGAKVYVAACVPPMVDLIQSMILVASSKLRGATADNAGDAYMRLPSPHGDKGNMGEGDKVDACGAMMA